jgi:hypothetical protein
MKLLAFWLTISKHTSIEVAGNGCKNDGGQSSEFKFSGIAEAGRKPGETTLQEEKIGENIGSR